MNKYIAAAAVVLSLAPGFAFAGEGNGPDFPGLQIPDVSVGVGMQPGSEGVVNETVSHRADADYEPSNGFPSPMTPDGIVRPGYARTHAVRRSVAAMPATPQG
jgi:hypothetical protein